MVTKTPESGTGEKVRIDLLAGLLKDLRNGVNGLLEAYEEPYVVINDCTRIFRGGNDYDFLRKNIPLKIADQVEPIKSFLNPESPAANKARNFLEKRIVTGLQALPEAFLSERQGREGAYGQALRDLKRSIRAFYSYVGQYVQLD